MYQEIQRNDTLGKKTEYKLILQWNISNKSLAEYTGKLLSNFSKCLELIDKTDTVSQIYFKNTLKYKKYKIQWLI